MVLDRLFKWSLILLCMPLAADDFGFMVPMELKSGQSYYISGQIGGMSPSEFMVDTGSSLMTINEESLDALTTAGEAVYLKDLKGVLANGSQIEVPVYRLTQVRIGDNCLLNDVEAAVFPGKTRQILGLSALSKAAPFIFSTDPPQLQLSDCKLSASHTGIQQVADRR